MQKIYKGLCALEGFLLKVLFIVLILVVWARVFNRVTINAQMAWSEELSRYLFVWVVFIAAAYASGEKVHIGVTALVDRLPRRAARVAELVCYLLCLAFSAVLIYYTAKIMQVQISFGQKSPSLHLPMAVAYSGMVVGGVFMFLHYVIHIGNFFLAGKTPVEGGSEA